MATNQRNECRFIGRMANDPKVFDNKDGSKTVSITLMCQNNYKNKNGQYDAVRVRMQQFINAERVKTNGEGVFGMINKGDLLAVSAHMTNNDWTDKDGNDHYDEVLVIDDVQMLEGKDAKAARMAQGAVAADSQDA